MKVRNDGVPVALSCTCMERYRGCMRIPGCCDRGRVEGRRIRQEYPRIVVTLSPSCFPDTDSILPNFAS